MTTATTVITGPPRWWAVSILVSVSAAIGFGTLAITGAEQHAIENAAVWVPALAAAVAFLVAVSTFWMIRRHPAATSAEYSQPGAFAGPLAQLARAEFGQIVAIARALDDDEADQLNLCYAACYGWRWRRVERAIYRRLIRSGRVAHLDQAAGSTWDKLDELHHIGGGAVGTALAVLARDVISRPEFILMTQPWVDAGLPIPDGIPTTHITASLSRFEDGSLQQSEEASVLKSSTAASARQLAIGMAAEIDVPAPWRLRLWYGVVSGKSGAAPDGFHERLED